MQTQTDIHSRLGALELGAIAPAADAALERTARLTLGPTRDPWVCHYIDDGALEAASLELQPRTIPHTLCFGIDDAGVERTAGPLPQPSPYTAGTTWCRHIGDDALETSQMGPPMTHPMMCHRIDDGALEEAAGVAAQPMTRKIFPNNPGCV